MAISHHFLRVKTFLFDVVALATSACNYDLSSATAYSLNVTLVPANGVPVSYVTLWPAGLDRPEASLMNSLDGRIKANAAVVMAGTAGKICFYGSEATDVLIDIDGYFKPVGPNSLEFYTMNSCRIMDTRIGLGGRTFSAGETRPVSVLGTACAQQFSPVQPLVYSLNVTAVPLRRGDRMSYLSVVPSGASIKTPVSTLNNPTGTIVANGAIVSAGDDRTDHRSCHSGDQRGHRYERLLRAPLRPAG